MSLAGLAGFAEGFGQAKQKKNDRERYDQFVAMQEAGLTRLGAAPQQSAPIGGIDLSAGSSGSGGGISTISQSLARTESGGDYNVVNSEGYTGKYQWGQARLNDFNRANGTSYKVADLRGNRALTEATQAWHERDILNDLGGYVGMNVGGIPMTPGAIVAMAHLGGKGGARRFIESGGKYDPADSNGTNLSKYARIHGGASQSPQPQPARRPAAVVEQSNPPAPAIPALGAVPRQTSPYRRTPQ